MATRKNVPTATATATAKPAKTVTRGPAPTGARTVDPKQPHPVGAKRTIAEAPNRTTVHVSTVDDERRREAAKVKAKDTSKAAAKEAAADLYAKLTNRELNPREVKAGELANLSAGQLQDIARTHRVSGHSGLTKDELARYLATGVKPVAVAGSARYGREQTARQVRDLKAKGLLTGPVSSLNVADLKAAVAKATSGVRVEVVKPTPKLGSMEGIKDLLRNPDGRGFTTLATSKAKAMFGTSVSNLKVAQVAQLVKALGLTA